MKPKHPEFGSERLAKYLETKLSAECDATTVIEMLDRGREFPIVDVRDGEPFEEGHLEGAISTPLDEFEDRAHELPEDEPIYVYCYDRECFASVRASLWLARHGYEPCDVVGGWEKLKAKGAPVEAGRRERTVRAVGGRN